MLVLMSITKHQEFCSKVIFSIHILMENMYYFIKNFNNFIRQIIIKNFKCTQYTKGFTKPFHQFIGNNVKK